LTGHTLVAAPGRRRASGHSEPPIQNDWKGGFESATHINHAGIRLDMVAATQHDREVAGDYARLRALGFRTAREGLRWHVIEPRPGRFDFTSMISLLEAADAAGVQIVWSLLHYGWPENLDVFGPDFVPRFAAFAHAAARHAARSGSSPPVWVPINEISFMAWAAGEVGYIHPFAVGCGVELKRQLVRAALAASDAVRAVDPRARLLHTDPLIHVRGASGRPETAANAALMTGYQYEAWDMLAGRLQPELGGAPAYLDLVGVNFYHANIWEYPDVRVPWEARAGDARWPRLADLLLAVHGRYGRPFVVAETSHFGAGRGSWVEMVTNEVGLAVGRGARIEGICLYPILDRPDWDDPGRWHQSGLWALQPGAGGRLERVLVPDYSAALEAARHRLPSPVED
jgi:UDP-galactopyranose mutase